MITRQMAKRHALEPPLMHPTTDVRTGIFQSLLLGPALRSSLEQWLVQLVEIMRILNPFNDLRKALMGIDNSKWHCANYCKSHMGPLWAWVALCSIHVRPPSPQTTNVAAGDAIKGLYAMLRFTDAVAASINSVHTESGEPFLRFAARTSTWAFDFILQSEADAVNLEHVHVARVYHAIEAKDDALAASLISTGWRYASALNAMWPTSNEPKGQTTLAHAIEYGLLETIRALLALMPAIDVLVGDNDEDLVTASQCAGQILEQKENHANWKRHAIFGAVSSAELWQRTRLNSDLHDVIWSTMTDIPAISCIYVIDLVCSFVFGAHT